MLLYLLGFEWQYSQYVLNKILKIKGKHFVVEMPNYKLMLKTVTINVIEKLKLSFLVGENNLAIDCFVVYGILWTSEKNLIKADEIIH
jgi:hypothetical protein